MASPAFLTPQQYADVQKAEQTVANFNKPINVTDLKQTAIPEIPQAPNVSSSVPTIQNLAQSEMQKISESEQIAQQGDKTRLDIANMFSQLAGQSEALAQAEQDAGVTGLKQNLQNLNNQIMMKQAEVQQDDVRLIAGLQQIEDKAIPMEFITGQQASVQQKAQIARALKMSEIGILNSQVMAAQGNITLAQETAQKAVDAKYNPIKEIINIKQSQLEAITPLLDRAEKKQAQAQQNLYNLQLKNIEDEKAKQKDLQSILINAQTQGAPQELVARATAAKTPNEAINILGKYAGDYLGSMLLREQIEKIRAEKIKAIAESNLASGVGVSGGVAGLTPKELETKVNQTNELYSLVTGLEKAITDNTGFKGAVGFGLQKLIPFKDEFIQGTSAQNFKLSVEQLKNALALPNLDKLKGAMSDKDIAFLKNIATKLDISMPEKAFIQEVSKLKGILTENLSKYAPTAEQYIDSIESSYFNSDSLTPEQYLNTFN